MVFRTRVFRLVDGLCRGRHKRSGRDGVSLNIIVMRKKARVGERIVVDARRGTIRMQTAAAAGRGGSKRPGGPVLGELLKGY